MAAGQRALLRDTAESRAHVLGLGGPISSSSVAWSVAFARRPSARAWYRAHNATIVTAYLEHRPLAEAESRAERFFINLVLVRVLYAHALVAAPRLALSWLSPLAPVLGDPRLEMTGIFLSLSRVLPHRYPLQQDLQQYLDEHSFARLLDIGVIRPRLDALYAWSAVELAIPGARHTAPQRCARLRLGHHRRAAVEPATAAGRSSDPTSPPAPKVRGLKTYGRGAEVVACHAHLIGPFWARWSAMTGPP